MKQLQPGHGAFKANYVDKSSRYQYGGLPQLWVIVNSTIIPAFTSNVQGSSTCQNFSLRFSRLNPRSILSRLANIVVIQPISPTR